MPNTKTSELTGAALDWAVAKCEGIFERTILEQVNGMWSIAVPDLECGFEPSTCWTQGGPIIEREGISVIQQKHEPGLWWASFCGAMDIGAHRHAQFAIAPLIAAMRCYVASKLGDEINIPEELCIPHTTHSQA